MLFFEEAKKQQKPQGKMALAEKDADGTQPSRAFSVVLPKQYDRPSVANQVAKGFQPFFDFGIVFFRDSDMVIFYF